ncbi:MAG: 30S ribosome-binding factor RbfA [Holosporales bacterium]|jgi:ribosome-binding factor A|nr:30S ribosome-binding factor RbfA [Holosporales bacterium]
MSKLDLFVPQKRKTTGRRNDKVAAQIKELFSLALIRGDFHSLQSSKMPALPSCLVTITYVDLSPDLCNATVFFTTLDSGTVDETIAFFKMQDHFFKDLIAKKLSLRVIPNIIFKIDKSIEQASRIDELLKNDGLTK